MRSLVLAAALLRAVAEAPPPPAPPPAAAAAPAPTVEVRILGINDFHGHIRSPARRIGGRGAGGAEVLASWLRDAARGDEARTVIVHAGDLVGASPAESGLLQDEPAVEFLNRLANRHCGFVPEPDPRCNLVAGLGNHEFDEGEAELLRLLRGGDHRAGPFLESPWGGAGFPVVCANAVRKTSGAPIVPASVVLAPGGVRVGFVGAVVRSTPSIVIAGATEGLRFEDEAEAINREAARLAARGVRAIVAVLHEGGVQAPYEGETSRDPLPVRGEIAGIVARLDGEVDAVVSGHTHAFTNAMLPARDGRPVLVTQAWSAGTAWADIRLEVSKASGEVVSKSAAIRTAWADGKRPDGVGPAHDIAALAAAAQAKVAPRVSRTVATAAEPISRAQDRAGESALGDLVADAQRAALGADVAFMNPGGLRADIDAGPITWGELFAVQPFGNPLVRLRLSGRQIRRILETQWSAAGDSRILQVSGIRYAWDGGRPRGSRVTRIEIGGRPLEDDATYSAAVNGFLAGGGDRFEPFRDGGGRKVEGTDLDALVEWLEKRPQPVQAKTDGRIRRAD